MSYQNEAWIMGATQVIVPTLGASVFPTKITSPPGTVGHQMKLLGAAGSTVHILPNSMTSINVAMISNGASAIGYPLNAVGSENTMIYGPANFYLAASGATATVAITFRFSANGATLAGASLA
jgi:hypothetical protein